MSEGWPDWHKDVGSVELGWHAAGFVVVGA